MRLKKSLSQYLELPKDFPFQTPCYVYSESILEELHAQFERALKSYNFPIPLRWHYAMKANALPRLLQFFSRLGSGIDLVSGGELREALECGYQGKDLVFSGIGKKDSEIREALQAGVLMLNVESEGELERIDRISKELGMAARFSLRVNPDVDAKTHPYISTGMWDHKFGLPFEEAKKLYLKTQSSKHLIPLGISLHIGSQIFDTTVLGEAVQKTLVLAADLKNSGISLEILDVGGGLGVDYKNPDEFPRFEDYAAFLHQSAQSWAQLTEGRGSLVFECGRAFTAQAGFLLTQVIGLKKSLKKNFLIVDGSMTELLRPALYKAEHPVWFVGRAPQKLSDSIKGLKWEVVGPVCESSDVLAREIVLEEVAEGDFIALGCAGAYGSVMSQTYNSRPLPAEWWIDLKSQWHLEKAPVLRAYGVEVIDR